MAELAPKALGHTGFRLSREQFGAIAWLRWRIFANGFRRKGGVGELIGRLLLLPFLVALAVLPTAGAGFFAWALAQRGSLPRISLVFWGTFALTQLLNINLGQPGTSFDPVDLIRFPFSLRGYVLVRLTFGLLSPANVVVTLMSAAIFAGVTLARPSLWLWALVATLAFALANVLFSRMVFAWVDRWLSTRRAREIFTGLIFAGSLGIQYVNVTFNPGFNHGHHRVAPHSLHVAHAFYHQLHPWLQVLPPELAASAVTAAEYRRYTASLAHTAGIALYAAAFVAVYVVRMRTEFRGENLSDQANAVQAASPKPVPTHSATPFPLLDPGPALALPLSSRLGPLLSKEILVLRRNTGLLYGVIAPTVMVFLFAGRLSLRGGSHWLLLMAAAYALLGLAPMSYNSFGLEGPGAQFYFMAPLRLRDVFFAKNALHFLLAAFELVVVMGIVAYVAGKPHPADMLFVVLWSVGTLLLNTTLGNVRSISAPKKVNPGRSLNRTQSQLSAWIAIGILAGSAAFAAGLQFLSSYLHQPWLGLALIAVFAAGSLLAYGHGLRGIESYALDRRESLFEELGKKI